MKNWREFDFFFYATKLSHCPLSLVDESHNLQICPRIKN